MMFEVNCDFSQPGLLTALTPKIKPDTERRLHVPTMKQAKGSRVSERSDRAVYPRTVNDSSDALEESSDDSDDNLALYEGGEGRR